MIQELRYIAKHQLIPHWDINGFIQPTTSHGVFISDSIIPASTVSWVRKHAALLEADAWNKKKWRDETNERILDLIHPSDYCLVHGRSVRRQKSNHLVGSNVFDYEGSMLTDFSRNFQWLPSEFKVKEDGSVDIKSYINNLNSRHHPELQEAIKSVFEIMVPMFELALGSLETEPLSREMKKDFQAPTDFKFRTHSLSGRTVQVIVKMANVHLTPEKPAFNGGRWHLEGMENEYIAATGILYYATENITSSRLTFRNKTEVLQYFSEYEEETQVCGKIEALQNRCAVFPNNLQHKVEDFELVDKSRPGHRKMLAFFLIHPDHKIVSTADVGIQQVDWIAEELFKSCGFGKKLPLEVVRQIALFTGAVMTEKEAREVAYQVADERKYDGSFTMKRP
ncbi:hypothetical protein HDU99_004248, partial [Rhizoclosmatium hyalinum]